jgi:xanthine dehydrogenase accessory factor
MTEDEVGCLHGPARLHIGSTTPPEIALSILAEMIATKNGVPRVVAGTQVQEAKAIVEA